MPNATPPPKTSPMPATGTEKRCRVLNHHGTEIVLVDLTGLNGQQAKGFVLSSEALIQARPAKSVRILTDVSQAGYDKEGLMVLKAWALRNTPFILASAVVGADGLRAAALNAVAFVTNRNIKPFSTRAEALDWLAAQH